MRELEEQDVGAGDLDGRAAGGEERAIEQVRLRGDREPASVLIASNDPRTRNAPDSHHDRDEARERRAEQQRPRERDPSDAAVEEPRAVPADVELQPADQRGGGERAEPGERHLTERELAAPAR